MTSGENDPPGLYYMVATDARLRLVYEDGVWSGTCTWTRTARNTVFDENGDPAGYEWTNTSGGQQVTQAPLREPTDVKPGDRVKVEAFGPACEYAGLGFDDLTVVRQESHSAPRQADGSMSWYAEWRPEWPAHAYAYWDAKTGLVLAYRDSARSSYHDGWMVDTDAPLS